MKRTAAEWKGYLTGLTHRPKMSDVLQLVAQIAELEVKTLELTRLLNIATKSENPHP